MPIQFQISVEVPEASPLADIGQRREVLDTLVDRLIDHGATAVRWLDASDKAGDATNCPDDVLIDFLLKQRRAVEKKLLIQHLNHHRIGLNSARSLIAALQERGRLREFQVPRDGRKSAVFVALIA